MSLMKRLIGQKKKKPTEKQKTQQINAAINGLREQITRLEKTKAHIDKKIANYTKEASQCMKNKNKKGAILKLKLRKQNQKRIETLDNQIMNLELQVMTLEESIMNKLTVDAMRKGADQMKQLATDKDMEDVEKLQDDLQDAMDLQKDINDLLSEPLGDVYDDEELLGELDALEDDGLLYPDKMKANVNNNMDQKTNEEEEEDLDYDEDDELDKLEEMMGNKKKGKKVQMEMNLASTINVEVVQSSRKMVIASC